jgi:hypothetical protein
MYLPWLTQSVSADDVLVVGFFGNYVCCRDAFQKFLLESLILAQDERWRRA